MKTVLFARLCNVRCPECRFHSVATEFAEYSERAVTKI
jgi:hypothetical protein